MANNTSEVKSVKPAQFAALGLGVVTFFVALIAHRNGWNVWPTISVSILATLLLALGVWRQATASSTPNDTSGLRLGLIIGLVAVVILGIIQIGHPKGFSSNAFDFLSHAQPPLFPGPNYWVALHIVQGICLVALAASMVLIARMFGRGWAIATTIAAIVFGALYTIFDSVAGVAIGVLVIHGPQYGADPAALKQIVNAMFLDPNFGGTGSTLSYAATISWLFAISVFAMGLARTGGPIWIVAVISVASGYLAWSHVFWFGPVAMLFMAIAFVGLWFTLQRQSALNQPT